MSVPIVRSTRGTARPSENLNTAQAKRARRELENWPALKSAYQKLHTLVRDATMDEANRKHAVGAVVHRASEDTDNYGKRSVETLGVLLGYDKSTLHDYAKVAETWSATELKKLLRRKSEDLKLPLTFSHLIELAQFDKKEKGKCNDTLEKVLQGSLSVRQLRLLMQGPAEADEGDEPDSEPAEARDVRRTAAAWRGEVDQLKRKTKWVIQRAKSNPVPQVLKELGDCAEQQRAIAVQAAENAALLDSARAELAPKTLKAV